MHVVEVGGELHGRAVARPRVGVDAAAHLRAVEREVDERFHTHGLGHVEVGVERDLAGFQMRARFRDVLGPQAQQEFAVARVGLVVLSPLRRHLEDDAVREPHVEIVAAVLEPAGDEVHGGRADEARHEARLRVVVELLR